MEKIWFRNFRLCTFAALSLIAGNAGFAEDLSKSVIVDVEVPIENDNMAEAKSIAQKQAFEKAVEQSLPATIEPAEKDKKIKAALQYIKTYQVIEEKMVGSALRQKFKVEVLLQETPSTGAGGELFSTSDAHVTFEVAWMPDETRFNAVDFLKYVKETMQTPVINFRIGRGNLTLTLTLRKSLEETQTQIGSFVGKRGLVKLIRQDANRPSDQIATPVVLPNNETSVKPGEVPFQGGAPAQRSIPVENIPKPVPDMQGLKPLPPAQPAQPQISPPTNP